MSEVNQPFYHRGASFWIVMCSTISVVITVASISAEVVSCVAMVSGLTMAAHTSCAEPCDRSPCPIKVIDEACSLEPTNGSASLTDAADGTFGDFILQNSAHARPDVRPGDVIAARLAPHNVNTWTAIVLRSGLAHAAEKCGPCRSPSGLLTRALQTDVPIPQTT